MAFTEQLSQALSIPVASLFPVNMTIGTTVSVITGIPLKNFKRLMAHVLVGLGGGNFTVAFQGSPNTTAASYKPLTVQSAAGLTFVTLATVEGTLEVRTDQFNPSDQFAALAISLAATSSNIAASVYGGESPYKPCNQYDATTITRAVV